MTLSPGIAASQITRYLGGHTPLPVVAEVVLDWQFKTASGTYTESIPLGDEDPGRYFVVHTMQAQSSGTGSTGASDVTLDGVLLDSGRAVGTISGSRAWDRVHVLYKPTGTGNVALSVIANNNRLAYRVLKVTNAVFRNWRPGYYYNNSMTAALGPISMPVEAAQLVLAELWNGQDSANMFDPNLTLFGATQDLSSIAGGSYQQRLQGAVETITSTGTFSVSAEATADNRGKAINLLLFAPRSEVVPGQVQLEPVVSFRDMASAPSTTAQTFGIDLGPEDPGRYFVVALLNGRGPTGGAASRSMLTLDGELFSSMRQAFQTTNRGSCELFYIHKPTGTGRGTIALTVYATDANGGVPTLSVAKVTGGQFRALKSTAAVSGTTGNPLALSGMNADSLTLGYGIVSDNTAYDLTDRSLWSASPVFGDLLTAAASGLAARSELTYIRGASATVEQKTSASALIKLNMGLAFDPYTSIPTRYSYVTAAARTATAPLDWGYLLRAKGAWWSNAAPTRLTAPATGLARISANVYRTSAHTLTTTLNGSEYWGNMHAIKADRTGGYGLNGVSAITSVNSGDYFGVSTEGVNITYTHWATVEMLDPATKYALAGKTTTQSISANTWTAISWATPAVDTSSFYSAGNPTRLTVPSGVSRVRITAQVQDDNSAAASTANSQALRVTRNGSTSGHGLAYTRETRYAGNQISHLSTAIIDVTPGDYFELEINSTWACNVVTANSWFQIEAIPSSTRYVLVDLASNFSITSGGTITWGNAVHDPEGVWNSGAGFVIPPGVDEVRLSYGMYITGNSANSAAAMRFDSTLCDYFPRQNRYAANVSGYTAFGGWVGLGVSEANTPSNTALQTGSVIDLTTISTTGSALNANAYSWMQMEFR